ncbi:MAG: putative restriction endonuclease [Solirubrobacteraceae bacterium]|nr:putative restriction endonuclease [Solirubrobacteraceae bacterium]
MDPDFHVRLAAMAHLHALSRRFTDMIPRREILENLVVDGQPYALVNPQSGIHRPRPFRGPAALTIVTTAPKPNAPPPYDDVFNEDDGSIMYSYRQGSIDSADNRALRAAYTEQVPLIYLMGVAPSVYSLAAPVYVVEDMRAERAVLVQIGSRATDLTPAGMRSDLDVRRYALRETRYRLHQHRFRFNVLAAYRHRCTICALKEPSLLQAAHIVEDTHVRGEATVTNGLSLCAIHHLAYDRHVLGIDPAGTVHIAARLLEQEDGPMLRAGLQGFHMQRMSLPSRMQDRPDPERLALRFDRFLAA